MGRRAIVVGGSIAGMLAARVLADHFEKVVVIERDTPSDGPEQRRSVAQGRHFHVLHRGGEDVLEALFPGIQEELRRDGSVSVNVGRDFLLIRGGRIGPRRSFGFDNLYQSRPLLERRIRTRTEALPNVRFAYGAQVTALVAHGKSRVEGVGIRFAGKCERELEAQLVVDAGGRAARSPRWLEQLGHDRIPETTVGLDFSYSSCEFEIPADSDADWLGILSTPIAPARRGGALVPIEGKRWLVTLAGRLGEHPPVDLDGFLAFAESLSSPEIHRAIRDAKPCGPPCRYRFPTGVLRHYERMHRFPEGLLPIGDAICSLNPLYGQGMSVAALQVEALGKLLAEREGRPSPLDGLWRDFLPRAARTAKNAWTLACGQDFQYPETVGRRPRFFGAQRWLAGRLQELTGTDPEAAQQFGRVIQLLDPPSALFRPRLVLRALLSLPSSNGSRG